MLQYKRKILTIIINFRQKTNPRNPDLTTFDRRQRLITLLQNQPGISVFEMANLVDVSEGTIRNDLNALTKEGRLVRVRGGARLVEGSFSHSPGFAERSKVNENSKKTIGRWAADLVEDGDSILMDASSTVYYMARHLHNRRKLRVFTNGIEVARALARNPSNEVVLLGGVLNTDGSSITGLVNEGLLKDLHIKTAFVSGSGFTPETGLTEVHISEAQLKARVIHSAQKVIALVDSGKIGKVDLTPFARIEQIAHLYVDQNLSPEWIEKLKKTCLTFTLCDLNTVSTFTPCSTEARHYRIGFANLDEQLPFSVDVRRGLERAVEGVGNIDLVLADNQLNPDVAFQVAERFVQQNLDLVVEYQIDVQANNRIMDLFQRAGIPVIAVDIPIVGAIFFGVDNYRAGHMAGKALGKWVSTYWNGTFDRLIILEEPRAGELPAARIQGQIEGLKAEVGEIPDEKRMVLNSGNTSEVSEEQMMATLESVPGEHRLAVICFNDDAAMGALTAARRLNREADVIIVGQGADRLVREELRNPESRIIGSTAYYPEQYGKQIISLALKILRGEPVPPAVYMKHTFFEGIPDVETDPRLVSQA
jgi:DeoR/GlpR family transcriptional regulator of sugar metabolism/DNA-binding LacI/PurR family transcriptional regulator